MEGIVPASNNGFDNSVYTAGRQNTVAAETGGKNRVEDATAAGVSQKKIPMMEECQTCSNRRYQDGSDDPGVSFKSPTRMDPAQAAVMVFSHEREHYSRENANAQAEGREVVSNDIRVFTDVCPECGKVYVSGGETRTVTRKEMDRAQSLKDFYDETLGGQRGKTLDTKI